MIAKPARNDTVMHDRLVGLVLEVIVPTRPEFREGPLVELVELLLSGTRLHAGFNTVGGEGPHGRECSTGRRPFAEPSRHRG